MAEVKYWRTKSGAEIDIILQSGQNVIPVEVKYINTTKAKVGKSIYSFIEKYSPPVAYVVCSDDEKIVKRIGNTDVIICDFREVLYSDIFSKFKD